MKGLICALFVFFGVASHVSARGRISTEVAPIWGYELSQKTVPNNHTRLRMAYGLRVAWGHSLLSIEAEFLKTGDTETFATDPTLVSDSALKAKLGGRTRVPIGKDTFFLGRLGFQGTRNVHHEESSSGPVDTFQAIQYKPYLGVGISFELVRALLFDIDVTSVFVNFPTNYGTNDYQAMAALVYRFP